MSDIIKTIESALDKVADPKYGSDGLNIVISYNKEASLADAKKVQALLDQTDSGPLAGVPLIVKDNIATLDTPTTCGSKILRGYQSPYEATVISKLRAAGAIPVAKANMDEFAMGSSTENSSYGPTKNPLDPTRVPGGSSGGSAAAVAAGIAPIALGSETGGSIRQPAAFCGIVGVKPTYGRVSRYGLVAFASSLDQIGVFANNVKDAAVATYITAGKDPRDATSADVAVPGYSEAKDLNGMTIGIPKEYFPESLDSGVRARCNAAIEALKSAGASIKEISLPHSSLAIQTYYIIAPAEASSNLARFDGVRYGVRKSGNGDLTSMYETTRTEGFGDEVLRRIMLGTYVLSHGYYDAYYKKALSVQSLIRQDFSNAFRDGVDAIFTPTTPTTAFKLGAVTDPYEMYLSDVFTATANIAGVPAMSQPIGREDGMPVGGQIIANHFDEPTMFKVATVLETTLGQDAHR